MSSEIYYERGKYIAPPTTIYAEWFGVDIPNPCRKYHITAAVESGRAVVDIVLPYLKSVKIGHKVVQNRAFHCQQTSGIYRESIGKFITVYMPPSFGEKNQIMTGLFVELVRAAESGVKPGPWPLFRHQDYAPDQTKVFEKPVYLAPANKRFIFGGYVCNSED
ncbi:MAG: hypothetical protein HC808_02565 [Candidatus Competibacteraceae bacterium]|nr:hypothetical protein [Candidatus Competibacteraceae bacterium]